MCLLCRTTLVVKERRWVIICTFDGGRGAAAEGEQTNREMCGLEILMNVIQYLRNKTLVDEEEEGKL